MKRIDPQDQKAIAAMVLELVEKEMVAILVRLDKPAEKPEGGKA